MMQLKSILWHAAQDTLYAFRSNWHHGMIMAQEPVSDELE